MIYIFPAFYTFNTMVYSCFLKLFTLNFYNKGIIFLLTVTGT